MQKGKLTEFTMPFCESSFVQENMICLWYTKYNVEFFSLLQTYSFPYPEMKYHTLLNSLLCILNNLSLWITYFDVQPLRWWLKTFSRTSHQLFSRNKDIFGTYFPKMLHLWCPTLHNFIHLMKFSKKWCFTPRDNLQVEHNTLYYFSSHFIHFLFSHPHFERAQKNAKITWH